MPLPLSLTEPTSHSAAISIEFTDRSNEHVVIVPHIATSQKLIARVPTLSILANTLSPIASNVASSPALTSSTQTLFHTRPTRFQSDETMRAAEASRRQTCARRSRSTRQRTALATLFSPPHQMPMPMPPPRQKTALCLRHRSSPIRFTCLTRADRLSLWCRSGVATKGGRTTTR